MRIPEDSDLSWARAMYRGVLRDVMLLAQFGAAHMIQRVVWDRAPADQRKRFMAQDYVRLEKDRVVLTKYGISVLGYREWIGA